MKLLAWDTSSKSAAIAAVEWSPGDTQPKLIAELACNVDTQHSECLLWGVHQVVQAARWKLQEVDMFGVGVGPGSFTGLRIGMTTARTLASSLQKPLIGVSSLAALARPHAREMLVLKPKTLLIAGSDACKGELYVIWGGVKSISECVAMSSDDLPGIWKRGTHEECTSPIELEKKIKAVLKKSDFQKWMVVGEVKDRFMDLWATLPKAKRIDSRILYGDQVQGRYVALLAWEASQAGLGRSPLLVYPRYLKNSDAENKLRAGLLPPGPTRGHA